MATNSPQQLAVRLRQEVVRQGKLLEEKLAGLRIAHILGPSYSSVHIGHSSLESDCRLIEHQREVGLIEVTKDNDELYEALKSEIHKSPKAERVDIDSGLGAWTCELLRTAKFKHLDGNRMSSLVRQILDLGIEDVHIDFHWPPGPTLESLKELGIRSLHRISDVGDYVFRHLPSEGGVIDDSPELLANYAEEYFSRQKAKEKASRLSLRAGLLKPYFCLVLGSQSPYSARFRMEGMSLVSPLPSRTIEIPESLSELWIMSSTSGHMLRYVPETGWFHHPSAISDGAWRQFLAPQDVYEIEQLVNQYFEVSFKLRQLE